MFHQMRAGTLVFQVNEDASRVRWSADGLPMRCPERADFWRAHMDDGECREMTVRSSRQFGVVQPVEGGLDIRYPELVGNDGRKFAVALTVHIRVTDRSGYACFEMWADVDNRDEARVNELQLPFVDLSAIGSEKTEEDVLYKMSGLGEKIVNPWAAIKQRHTEYMAADYNEIWDSMLYPCFASMCWFGVQSGDHFLYIGKHDPEIRTAALVTGVAPRRADPRLILAISHFPLVKQGECLESAHSVVSLNEGDWRTGSDIYGGFARANWYSVPEKPEWVRNFAGWQRIILKHQYGEIFFTYSDLPRIYEEGRRYGLEMLLLFGWWKGRFDNGYPLYEPDPALGGADGLKAAIREVQEKGGRVALYTNGVLIDIQSDFYKETGYRICRKDIDHNEYREHYKFSNDGMTLRSFGYKSFVSACQATPEWREKLLENERIKLDFGADSLFVDQIGGHFPNLCFDETHLHGARGDSEAKWRIENLEAIRSLCNPDQAFGSEFTVDAYAPHLHYHHGCMLGNIYAKSAFPDMFLRTFPEPIQTNRFLHDDREDFKRILNYIFLYNFRFDISIYRGRKLIVSDLPEFAEYLKGLIDLKDRYRKFFYGGKFVVNTLLELPSGVQAKEYLAEDGDTLFALWNDSAEAVRVTIGGNFADLAPQGVGCIVRPTACP